MRRMGGRGGGEKLAVRESYSKSVGWWFSSAGKRVVNPVVREDGAEEGARGSSEGIGCLVSLIYFFPTRS